MLRRSRTVIGTLNTAVRAALAAVDAAEERTIPLPTGDGVAIALLDEPAYDVHVRLALELLRLVDSANLDAPDTSRQFQIRVGVNENVDNVVTDINGRRNVAGAGVSTAQRIMDQADGGQILVGESVYEILRHREFYKSRFRSYEARDKHNSVFRVFQYVEDNRQGLNRSEPSAFSSRRESDPKLTLFAAFFIADARAHRSFFLAA